MQNTTKNSIPSKRNHSFWQRSQVSLPLLLGLTLLPPLLSSRVNGSLRPPGSEWGSTRDLPNNDRAPGNRQLKQRPVAGGPTSVDSGATPKADASRKVVDSHVPDDPALLKMLEPYRARVRSLNVVIGQLKGDLQKKGIGAGNLGNFVTDGLRAEASRILAKPVLLMVINAGGLRKNTIAEGQLRVQDIFELLPFENALIQIDLTGEQLTRVLEAVVASRDAQSGARLTYREDQDRRPELVTARLVDSRGRETPINPNSTYTIVTIDYLYGLRSGRYSILREGKNMRPIGTSMRDALVRYVRNETARRRTVGAKLDGRFISVNGDINNEPAPQ